MSPRTRRIGAFLVLSLALQVSPFLVQVRRIRNVPMVRGWRMYERTGADLCDVRFFEHHGDGSRTPIPFETVAGSYPRRIRKAEDADMLARSQCRSGRDVRMTARCGDWYDGWVVVRDGSARVCPP